MTQYLEDFLDDGVSASEAKGGWNLGDALLLWELFRHFLSMWRNSKGERLPGTGR